MADIFDELESGDIFDQIEPEAEPGQFGGGQGGQFKGTGTTGGWEKPDLTERAINYEDKLIGGLTKGGMRLGEAILRAPAMAVRQAGFLRQVGMANRILQEPDPKRQASMLADMEASKQAFDSIAETLDKPAELHKVGQRIIEHNHPEWANDPPEGFIDLLTHPDKLGVALAESMPVLLGAGILTAAGMPNVAMGMMYVAEGQSAYDQAIEDEASKEDAALTYVINGSVSAVLEKMQLKGIIKVAKGSYNALLNRTVQKVAKQGLKSLTGEAIKVAAQEALEEISQGAWQELTAKMVYDKSIPGGVAGFIDRRAQEAYLGFMMGLIPAAGGGVVGAIKGSKQVGSVAAQEQTTEQPVEQPVEAPTEQPISNEPLTKSEVQQVMAKTGKRLGEVLQMSISEARSELGKVEGKQEQVIAAEIDAAFAANDIDKIEQLAKRLPAKSKLREEAFHVAFLMRDKMGLIKPLSTEERRELSEEIQRMTDEMLSKKSSVVKQGEQGEISQQATGEATVNMPGTKVVDAAGTPIKVYHGTWTKFPITKAERMWKAKERREGAIDTIGIWFTNKREGGGLYGPITKSAYLNLQNPYIVSGEGAANDLFDVAHKSGGEKLRQDLIAKGYDGIIIEGDTIDGEKQNVYVAFEPSQIQEAEPDIPSYDYGTKTFPSEFRKEVKHLYPEAPGQGKAVEPPKPKRIAPRQALKIGHDLPKKMGWTEAQRYDFNQQVVGKRSMKDMSPQEKQMVAQALQEQARDAGLLPPEDYPKTLFVGAEEIETDKFMEGTVAQVESLKDRSKKTPKIITHRFGKRKRGLLALAKDITVGIDNLSITHLLNKIGATTEGPLKKVKDYMRRGMHAKAAVFRQGVDYVNDAIKQAGITANDLAEYGRSLDPRMELVKTIRELVGKPKTKYYDLDINGKTIRMSMAELTDIYLTNLQRTGPGHIEGGGLSIYKYDTGPVSKETIDEIKSLVENDKVASVLIKAFTDVSTNINAPQLNYTNGRLNPETIDKLADEENYWHVDVKKKKRIMGKETYSISFLENKGFLKPRQGGAQSIVVRNAFDKFFAIQSAVGEYVGMAEPVRLLNMTLNYQPVVDSLEAKGYEGIRNNVKQLVEWAQNPASNVTSTDKFLGKILHGAYRAVLHFSPEIIVSQYMSTGHYAGIVDPKYAPMLAVPPTPGLVKEMLDKNPVVWTRYYAGGQSVEMAELGELDTSLRLLTGKHTDLNKTGIAAQTTDLAAFAQGWKLAKAIVSDTTDLKPTQPEYWDAVSEQAEELWDTQPSWDKWNKSINTSQRGIKKLPFLFRSYFESSLRMLHTANATYESSSKTTNDKAKWAQTYGAVLSSQMATALLRTFIGWAVWRKRKTVWDYLAAMVAAPFGMVSTVGGYMGRVVGNVIKIVTGEKPNYEGEPISTLPGKTMEEFFLGVSQMTHAASYYLDGNEEKANQKIKSATKNIIRSTGTMNGVPVRQIEKIIKAIEPEKVEGGWVYE